MRHVLAPGLLCLGFLFASSLVWAQGPPMNYEGNPGGVRYLEEGMPPVVIHATVEAERHARAQGFASGTNNLYYHGGVGGIGVETAPKVYLVLWGSQWNNNDPSGEAANIQNFLSDVGNSSWLNSVTQYCQGVASGTYSCNGAGAAAGNPSGILAGIWSDNSGPAPNRPRQSQIANEAAKAAVHFGNTTAASNASVQYVIATAHGYNAGGFGTQYCAWHSSTSSSSGNLAYTNLPYITDAGASCGANFNGLGPNAGQTIVEGHELAETITDQFPNGGWLDSAGSENGDKCAWSSATTKMTLTNNGSFPVQPLWSNSTSSCVLSY